MREISHLNDVTVTLREDRDRALATLKHYGLEVNKDIDVSFMQYAAVHLR